jgi:hypothetical protein
MRTTKRMKKRKKRKKSRWRRGAILKRRRPIIWNMTRGRHERRRGEERGTGRERKNGRRGGWKKR